MTARAPSTLPGSILKVTVRLTPAELATLRSLAQRDSRSMNSMVRAMIRREAARGGMILTADSRQTDG